MTAAELLADLELQGFRLRPGDTGKLLVHPADRLTLETEATLREYKAGILAVLQERTEMTGQLPTPAPKPPAVMVAPRPCPPVPKSTLSPGTLSPPADVLRLIERSGVVAFDLETTGLSPRSARARLLSVSDGKRALVLDLWACDPTPILIALGGRILVAHHATFDLGFLWHLGLRDLPRTICTFLLAELLHAGTLSKSGLAPCCFDYLDGLVLPKEQQASDWSGNLTAEQIEYSRQDAAVLIPLLFRLNEAIEKAGLQKAADIELRALPSFVWLIQSGTPFDQLGWLGLAKKAADEKASQGTMLDTICPPKGGDGLFGPLETWNWDSPQQVSDVLALMGFRVGTTNDAQLSMIPHKVGQVLRLHRQQAQLLKMYGQSWLDGAEIKEGRVYPGWRQLGTATGRTSCCGPNMQQLPRQVEYRRCIAAPTGRVLVKADYSQLQLRIAAKMSGDPTMLKVYQSKGDIHTATAQALLGKKQVTKADRQIAKSCIAEGQLVLTQVGLIPIEKITCWHSVWDGLDWVRHDGVVFQGYQEVIEYDGLTATPDHEIYLESGKKVPFGTAALAMGGSRIAVTAVEGLPVRYKGDCGGHHRREIPADSPSLFGLQPDHRSQCRFDPQRDCRQLPLPAKPQVRGEADGSCSSPGRALRFHSPALHQSQKRIVAQLWRTGHRVAFSITRSLYSLVCEVPETPRLQGSGHRPHEQRRSLRAWEPETGSAPFEFGEQTDESHGDLQGSACMHSSSVALTQNRPSRLPLSVGLHSQTCCPPRNRRSCAGLPQAEPKSAQGSETTRSGSSRIVRVYDILNAGPRHRFTVSGKLVSNCNFGLLFGMGAESLRIYSKMTYDVDFTEEEATSHRETFFKTYRGLSRWHWKIKQAHANEARGTTGRRRLFHPQTPDTERINTPVQQDESDGLKLAMALLWERRADCPGAFPVLAVHDEIVIEADIDQAEQAKSWLTEAMLDGMADLLEPVPCECEADVRPCWGK